MQLSTVKMLIDSGRDKPSASLSLLIVRSIFLTYLRCFCITLVRPFVNLSETIAGYRSNRSPLLIMLTEPTFCRNSSINISIDNRCDNRFIHLRRPIFTANHNGACVYNSAYTWDGTAHPICERGVGSSLLNSSILLLFRQPLTSSIIVFTSSPTCLLVQTQLQSIQWPWASVPNNLPFLPVGMLWLPVIAWWL